MNSEEAYLRVSLDSGLFNIMYIRLNENPYDKLVGDCTVRAISTFLNQDWDTTYIGLVVEGFIVKDMPNSNAVLGSYLMNRRCTKELIPNTCPNCYTVRDFCNYHPLRDYLLATGSHVIAVHNGDYYDTYDSGDMVPIYFWRRN